MLSSARTALPADFHQKILQELTTESAKDYINKEKIEGLTLILQADSLESLFTKLATSADKKFISVVATSHTMQRLITLYPDAFIQFYSRDFFKAIIYQACRNGNITLATTLIDKINMDVLTETAGDPERATYLHQENGEIVLMDQESLLIAGAKSTSVVTMMLLVERVHLKADKTAITGPLQSAMATAAANGADAVVDYLLSLGINPNAALKAEAEGAYSSALYYAGLYGSINMIMNLVNHGAKIHDLYKRHAVSRGRLDVIQFYVALGHTFETKYADSYVAEALGSGSVRTVEYLLEDQKATLYQYNESEYEKRDLLRKVLDSGSVYMAIYAEDKLGLPLTPLIKAELEQNQTFHHMNGTYLMLEAVCAYSVPLLDYLIERKGITLSASHLASLLPYAKNCGKCLPQMQMFNTYAYLFQFTLSDPHDKALFQTLSRASDLSKFRATELIRLYTLYTKEFRDQARYRGRRIYTRELDANAHLLAREIARRNLSPAALLKLANANHGKLAPDVQFFLLTSNEGFTADQTIAMLNDVAFYPNHDYGKGFRPLHYVVLYDRQYLIAPLLQMGADPDAETDYHFTAITMLNPTSIVIPHMVKSAGVVKTLHCCLHADQSNALRPVLEALGGDIGTMDMQHWLATATDARIVYDALCLLNANNFAIAQERLSTSGDKVLLQALALAEQFKQTGKLPDEYARNDRSYSFFGICCGVGELALQAAPVAPEAPVEAEASPLSPPQP